MIDLTKQEVKAVLDAIQIVSDLLEDVAIEWPKDELEALDSAYTTLMFTEAAMNQKGRET